MLRSPLSSLAVLPKSNYVQILKATVKFEYYMNRKVVCSLLHYEHLRRNNNNPFLSVYTLPQASIQYRGDV